MLKVSIQLKVEISLNVVICLRGILSSTLMLDSNFDLLVAPHERQIKDSNKKKKHCPSQNTFKLLSLMMMFLTVGYGYKDDSMSYIYLICRFAVCLTSSCYIH